MWTFPFHVPSSNTASLRNWKWKNRRISRTGLTNAFLIFSMNLKSSQDWNSCGQISKKLIFLVIWSSQPDAGKLAPAALASLLGPSGEGILSCRSQPALSFPRVSAHCKQHSTTHMAAFSRAAGRRLKQEKESRKQETEPQNGQKGLRETWLF